MGKDLTKVDKVMYFCNGGSCSQKGADRLTREARARLKQHGLYQATHTVKTLCMGQCEHGPILVVQPDNTWYMKINEGKTEQIIQEHIINLKPKELFLLYNNADNIMYAEGKTSLSQPKHFEIKEDLELGSVYIAYMDAWEMNLYPLIRDLFINHFQGLRFEFPSFHEFISLSEPALVEYDGIQADVTFEKKYLQFVIGVFKDSHPNYSRLIEQRITEVAFYKKINELEDASEWKIMAKNRTGQCVFRVHFPYMTDMKANEMIQLHWEHYKKIYLETI